MVFFSSLVCGEKIRSHFSVQSIVPYLQLKLVLQPFHPVTEAIHSEGVCTHPLKCYLKLSSTTEGIYRQPSKVFTNSFQPKFHSSKGFCVRSRYNEALTRHDSVSLCNAPHKSLSKALLGGMTIADVSQHDVLLFCLCSAV